MRANKLTFVVTMGALLTALGSGAIAQNMPAGIPMATDPLSHGATVQMDMPSTTSRDEVREVARQAAAQDMHSNQVSGDHASHVAPAAKAAQSLKSRDEVRMETRQASAKDMHSNQI
ncbi:MAG TPA: hypothetical protein DHV59_15785 [Oxalobacteraceae bacterium]|nr:hypothetical protein [Oxalobacteraceae bacterium]